MPRNIIIMLLNIIFMPLHIIIMLLNIIITLLNIIFMPLVPRRLFFAALQRIAITASPKSKDAAFQNEKESKRIWPRSQVSLEKSSKNCSR